MVAISRDAMTKSIIEKMDLGFARKVGFGGVKLIKPLFFNDLGYISTCRIARSGIPEGMMRKIFSCVREGVFFLKVPVHYPAPLLTRECWDVYIFQSVVCLYV